MFERSLTIFVLVRRERCIATLLLIYKESTRTYRKIDIIKIYIKYTETRRMGSNTYDALRVRNLSYSNVGLR